MKRFGKFNLTPLLIRVAALVLMGASLLGGAPQALAHARWKLGSKVTPPRNDSTGLKTPPCGDVPRTATPVTFKPGQQVTVEFEETINHLGYFEIYFMPANDTIPGTPVALTTVQDNQNTPILNGANHQFTAQITLPTTECEGCTLQLIQTMQDQGPTGPKAFYYSCSDIRISNNPVPPAPAPPAPAPTPAPKTPPPSGTSTGTSQGTATGTGTTGTTPPSQDSPVSNKPEKPTGLKLEKQGSTP